MRSIKVSSLALWLVVAIMVLTMTAMRVQAAPGNAAQFSSGASSYIAASSSAELKTFSALTLEAWIRPNGGGEWATIMGKQYNGDNANPWWSYRLYVASADPSEQGFPRRVAFNIAPVSTGGEVGVASTTVVQNDIWTHVAGVYDGATMKIYINGTLENTVSQTGDLKGSDLPMYIGKAPWTNYNNYNGQMDELRIWNVARTQSQIRYAMNRSLEGNEEGLVAYWPFNDAAGSPTAADASQYDHVGTLYNGAAIVADSTAPVNMDFIAQTGMPVSTTIVSNPITITGISSPTAISITGGEYSVSSDGGTAWTAYSATTPATVSLNNQVRVRQISSGSYSTLTTATITIGGVSGAFNVTTAAATDPDASGLVAWWRAENSALDSVGGNNGTPQGGVSYAAGQVEEAFSLDGVDDYVDVPNSASLNPSSSITVAAWYRPVTFAGNGSNAIVSKGFTSHAEPYYQYHIGVNGDQYYSPSARPASFSFTVSPGGNRVAIETAENTWIPGNWYYLVGIYDGNEVKLYVNGVLKASTSATGTLADYGKSLRIGAFNNISSSIDYTPGLVDEVKIFNRALSAAEVAKLSGIVPDAFSFISQTGMPLSTTIVSNPITVTGIVVTTISITGGEYQINNGSWTSSAGTVNNGDSVKVRQISSTSNATMTTSTLTIGGVSGAFNVTTAASGDPNASGLVSWWRAENNGYDSVGGNHGTAMNGASYATGKLNLAFSLDGSDDAVRVPAASNLAVSSLTIAAWIKPAIDTNMPVIEWNNETGAPPSFGPQLWYRADGRLFGNVTELGETYFETASGVITVGAWNYVALTYDAASGIERLYANGAQVQEKSVGTLTLHTDFLLFIGRRPSSHNGPQEVISFNGLIDEVKVFNRALTDIEIQNICESAPYTFSFTAQTGMPLSTVIVSNPITVSGICGAKAISVAGVPGGAYQINGVSWTSEPGTVNNGDTVKVRQTSSASNSTTTTATLTIGTQSGAFDVTTAASGDPNASGLVSWWRAENNAYDSVGGNHGTPVNGAAYASGRVGQAFSFDGSGGYILVGDPVPSSLQIQNEITLSAWIYVAQYPSGDGMTGLGLIAGSQKDGSAAGATIFLDGRTNPDSQTAPPGHIHFQIGDGASWHTTNTNSQVPLNQWVHIVATRKAGEDAKIYYNGIPQQLTSVPWGGAISYDNAWFAIGQQKDVNRQFNGLIDEVRIFNRALSAPEVSTLAGTKPDAFSFINQTGVALSTPAVSNAVTVSGITNPATISITGGDYAISADGGSAWGNWTSTSGIISLNNQVKVRQTSSSSYSTTTTAILTIGGVDGVFSVTTAPDLTLAVTSPTNLVSQAISGTVKSGAAVTVSLNGGTAQPAIVAGTSWSYVVTGLHRGDNGITVNAADTGYAPTKSATINCIAPQLTVTVTGTGGANGMGGGTVTSVPAAITCTGGPCSALFDGLLPITLIPTADGDSLFSSWSGACTATSGDCEVTMPPDMNAGDKSAAASFAYVLPAQIEQTGVKYPQISDAYAALTGNGSILARQFQFDSDLNLNRGITILLKGGYNPAYSVNSGYSTIQGMLTVGKGSLTVERVVVK